jgi:hypothetical protein
VSRDLRRIGLGALAAARVAGGAAFLLAPRRTARTWIGATADAPGVTALARALGVRDALIGVGGLEAVARGGAVRPWFMAGAASDAVDAVATVLAWRSLPRGNRVAAVVIAGGAAVVGGYVASRAAAPTAPG